jgi:DNA (cytosine-5)-methyltransferase 1
VSSKKALENIPIDAPNGEIRTLSPTVIERLSYIKPGQNVWQAEDILPDHLKIKTKTRISQIYRKLDPDKPSYTITAAGGGGTFGYHWDNRELSNRERARIQTFPDNFAFVGKYASVRKQIGMAVPCQLSNVVVTAILNSFAGISYDSIDPNITI